MKQNAEFRVQLAELGHPVVGPQSYWKLTPAEVRIYAEGLKAKNESQQAQAKAAEEPGDADYAMERQKTKAKRDQQALQQVEQRAAQQ